MTPISTLSRRAIPLAAVILAFAWLVAALAPASAAASSGPQLQVTVLGEPTNFAPGDTSGHDVYYIDVVNVGDAPTDPTQNITVTDGLPAGLSVQSIEYYASPIGGPTQNQQADIAAFLCTPTPVLAGQPVVCNYPGAFRLPALQPHQRLWMFVHVTAAAGSGPITNSVTVSGGGAPQATASTTNYISSTPAPFGFRTFNVAATNADGTPDIQAGSHPYEFTTAFDLNTTWDAVDNQPADSGEPKDLTVDLPPGLIGDPQATPQCSLVTFWQQGCPLDSQVGTVSIAYNSIPDERANFPIYNLTPQPGRAAELGFTQQNNVHFILTAGVRTGDYGIQTSETGVPIVSLTSVTVTLWGVPADPSHDAERGLVCQSIPTSCAGGGAATAAPALPFLTLPTDCSAPGLNAGISADSWTDPSIQSDSASLPPVTGCDALSFEPTVTVVPDTSQAGAPAGLAVDIKVPQDDQPLPYSGFTPPGCHPGLDCTAPTGVDYSPVATPELRDATVTLPAGMTVNPSSAGGLVGCSDAQIALDSPDAATCPDASKIGTVLLHTPLLDHSLPGDVYLGTPQCSPCSPADAAAGRMVRLFIQIDDPLSGVIVKLPGTVSIDQSTGQLTTTFLQNPQLPFDELQLNLNGGPRAPLVNPDTCGTFTTTTDFAPWSAPFSGPDATPFSSFDITGCGDPSTFAPSFTAGVTSTQAAAHSSFVLSFSRSDADQQFSGLTVKLPPGLSAKLAGVPLCSDSDANAGTCPASSQVGDVETGAGAGSEPLFLPGKAFLTGPYKGGPYGLAVEVPAIAGPYNLGTVVVRQALYIDPTTAEVTAVSDPFPTELDGIPLRIRRVDVNVDRPDFMLNPTSCDPMSIGATLSSTGGMTAAMSSPFQVANCANLGFSPKLQFRLTGTGQTHSGSHPTLTATLTQGAGQANIRSAKVALPLSLALDINNSQHVCNYDTAQSVHGGAVGCPASTIVGQATAVTPLLSQPLSGPVYLVQGIRFGKNGQRIRTLPSLLVPLRGQIAIDLRASSAVNGAQQLVTTFNTIPDAPVSKFTLTINGGRHGLLVITGRGQNICTKAQVANASFGAQTGKANSQNDTMAKPCSAVAHRKRHSRRHTRRR